MVKFTDVKIEAGAVSRWDGGGETTMAFTW